MTFKQIVPSELHVRPVIAAVNTSSVAWGVLEIEVAVPLLFVAMTNSVIVSEV
jgi:hypothetical protein